MKALSRIVEFLSQGGATAEEISEGTGLPRTSCRVHLAELVRQGLVAKGHKVPREFVRSVHLYQLPDNGNKA